MRKVKYILAAITIFATTIAFSQTSFGVKGGLNFSNANSDLYIDALNNAPSTFTAFNVGVFSEIGLNETFFFQPELQYTRRGFTIDEGTSFNALGIDIPVGAKATTSINYIESPLLLKAKFGAEKMKFYGIAGPSIGYATSAKIQPKVTLLIDFNLPEIAINLDNDIYNKTDISGIIGGGIELPLASGSIFTDLRYQHSFSNIINDPIADISVKNTGIQLSVGYSHRF